MHARRVLKRYNSRKSERDPPIASIGNLFSPTVSRSITQDDFLRYYLPIAIENNWIKPPTFQYKYDIAQTTPGLVIPLSNASSLFVRDIAVDTNSTIIRFNLADGTRVATTFYQNVYVFLDTAVLDNANGSTQVVKYDSPILSAEIGGDTTYEYVIAYAEVIDNNPQIVQAHPNNLRYKPLT